MNTHELIHKREQKRGQILLIMVMLLATAVTVVLTIAFSSTTETQVTKLEQESQKALGAAEAGLELALKKGALTAGGTLNLSDELGSGITGTATIDSTPAKEFITPLLQRDEQYTFYFSDYPGFGNQWTGGSYNLYFHSENTTNCPALELTYALFDGTNWTTQKKVYNSCNTAVGTIGGGDSAITTSSPDNSVTADGQTTTFKYKVPSISLPATAKFVVIRTIFTSTRVAITSSSNLNLQGKKVSSTAKTNQNVTKEVRLFQSFPQIPADFFVTAF